MSEDDLTLPQDCDTEQQDAKPLRRRPQKSAKARKAVERREAARASRDPLIAAEAADEDPPLPVIAAEPTPLTPMPDAPAKAVAPVAPIYIQQGLPDAVAREQGARNRGLWQSFLAVVAVPVAAAGLWYGQFASDQFTSHASFAVRGPAGGGAADAPAILAPVLPGTDDALIVRDFIESRDMMAQLDTRLDLRAVWSSDRADSLTRLPEDATDEQLFATYQDQLSTSIKPGSALTSLAITTHDPESAQAIGSAVLALTDQFVTELSAKRQAEAVRATSANLAAAEQALKTIQARISDFRQEQKSVDSVAEATARLSLIANLEGQLAARETELRSVLSWMQPTSGRVQNLQQGIEALKAQIAEEREKSAGDGQGADTAQLAELESLTLDQRLAQQRYAAALSAHENALANARAEKLVLETVAAPSYPDAATGPQRGKSVLTVALTCLTLWILGLLLVASIREHVRV